MPSSSANNVKAFIKGQLKQKGLKYKDLAKKLDVAEVTVKRWLNKRDIKVETLLKIRSALDLTDLNLDFTESKFAEPQNFTRYTLQQERFFVNHPRDMLLFLKLHFEGNVEQARIAVGLSKSELLQSLKRLEKINVLEHWPGETIRLKLKGPFMPAQNGPMITQLFSKVRDTLMARFRQKFPPLSLLNAPGTIGQFRAYEFYCTEETAKNFSDDLRRIVAKYYQMGTSEARRKEKVAPISVMIGVDQFDVWSDVLRKL